MRRFLAVESVQARPVLSLEEEIIAEAEAQDDSQVIAEDLAEAERVVDVSEGLENVADIADSIEAATPAEVALVQTNADMAVAGTDIQAEEIIPIAGEALESMAGKRIATEGIRETAAKIWSSIQAFLKKIWARLESYWHKFFGQLPMLKRKLEAMKKRIEDAAGKKLEGKKFDLTSGVSSLSVDHSAVKKGSELISALEVYQRVTGAVFVDATKNAASLGEAIAETIEGIDAENAVKKAEELTAKLKKDLSSIKPNAAIGTKFSGSGYGEGYEVLQSAQLLGNVRLISKVAKADDQSDLGYLDSARKSGVSLVSSREGKTPDTKDISFETMSLSEMEKAIKVAEKIVDAIEDYERSSAAKDVKKARARLDTASSKASTAFGKIDRSSEGTSGDAVAAFRSMLNFNIAFTNWSSAAQVKLSQHTQRVVKATIYVVDRSLAQYK